MAGARKKSERATGRNAQLVRILDILRDLARAGGVDLYELAQRYGVNVRTVRRDLGALEAAGLPLVEEEHEDGKKKRWRVAYKEKLAELSSLVDATHYLALRIAMGAGNAESPLFTQLEDLSDKIEQALGPKGRSKLEEIEQALYSYDKFAWRNAPPDVFWPLVTAVVEKRVCRVTYRAPKVPATEKTFSAVPLRLFVHQGALYANAWVPKHSNVILLHLARLVRLELTDEKAKLPRDFDPRAWERASFGVFAGGMALDGTAQGPTLARDAREAQVRYKLRFSSVVGPYIRERQWHPSEQRADFPDGGCELQFRCVPSYEVTAWVASWRQHVEVIAPQELRAELAALGRYYAEHYGMESSRVSERSRTVSGR